MRANITLLDSFGLEVESDCMQRGNLPDRFRNLWNETHDASIESDVKLLTIGNARLNVFDPEHRLGNRYQNAVIGSEYVSSILDVNDQEHRKSVDDLLGWLYSQGESLESNRAGIHVHISMMYNLSILHNLSYLARYLEQVFYYVGGMGYEFRGVQNDFVYCRPLTSTGPTVVQDGNERCYQCFNLDNMVKSRSVEQFWDCYGGINVQAPPDKYYPVRYNWFTFYPLLSKGTVEFRVFNKTLNPLYVWSAIKLCRYFCAFSISNSTDYLSALPERSIYEPHSKDQIQADFKRFTDMAGVDQTTYAVISKIIDLTPKINIQPKLVHTHLRNNLRVRFRTIEPEYIDEDEVSNPKFVDLHVLRGER